MQRKLMLNPKRCDAIYSITRHTLHFFILFGWLIQKNFYMWLLWCGVNYCLIKCFQATCTHEWEKLGRSVKASHFPNNVYIYPLGLIACWEHPVVKKLSLVARLKGTGPASQKISFSFFPHLSGIAEHMTPTNHRGEKWQFIIMQQCCL